VTPFPIATLMNILETRFPDYEWRMIKDFRNFIVHEYFGVDERIIWDACRAAMTACLVLHFILL